MKQNLEGQKYNHLTVIRFAHNDKKQCQVWECKCDCGNITYANTSDLRNGHKKSCGCLKHLSHAKDHTGERFGMLTVIKRIGTNKHRKAVWRCKCDCGKKVNVSSVDLVTGNTKSCGCLGNSFAKRNLREGGYWYGKKDL